MTHHNTPPTRRVTPCPLIQRPTMQIDQRNKRCDELAYLAGATPNTARLTSVERDQRNEPLYWRFTVPSFSEPGVFYKVQYFFATRMAYCECSQGSVNIPCAHAGAARISAAARLEIEQHERDHAAELDQQRRRDDAHNDWLDSMYGPGRNGGR